MKKLLHTAAVFAALLSAPAWAQTAAVKVEGAWARASVQGQKATGAFMRLTAKDGARLVRAESPAAGLAEVHEMKMEGDIMKMRAVPTLDLPAGKTVELKPGGYHIMLLDLKAPLAKVNQSFCSSAILKFLREASNISSTTSTPITPPFCLLK